MKLDVESLRVFVRVADVRSFTQAAQQLGMPKARASAHVQKLEASLGTQLFHRSTRLVRPTPEGELLLRRARPFVTEADEIGALFQRERTLRGRVCVELPVGIARQFIIPKIPDLLARHPQLELDLRASDRYRTALREGFDIVLRLGGSPEGGLVGRRFGALPMTNLASASYLSQHGVPRSIADLKDHLIVRFAADPSPVFEYFDGKDYVEVPMRSVLTVDNVDAYLAACVAGLGIVQVPKPGQRSIEPLVEVLPEFTARPLRVTLLHTHGRSVPRRVRAVMTWLTEQLAPALGALHAGA
ncbi:MAG: LysR family transcriptional regulator [Deltaproteobacteria bacterium]|nr:LysR family transcriptional regulator [Deltaproteobacteria bacterium]